MNQRPLQIRFSATSSGLLLPSHFVDRQMERSSDSNLLGVYVTMREIKSGVPTPQRTLIAKARGYFFDDLVLSACKVNLFLARHGQTNPQLQVALGKDLLADRYLTPLITLQNDHSDRMGDRQASRPVFTTLLVLHFLKQLYLNHDGRVGAYIDSETNPDSVKDFGYLLLSFSDFLGQQVKRADRRTPKATAMEMVRNYLLCNSESLRHLLPRYYQLLFVIPQDIDGRAYFADTLASLFWKTNRVSIKNYFSLGFGVLTRFANINYFAPVNTENPNEDFILDWEHYFANLKIPKMQTKRLLQMYSLPATEMRARIHNLVQQENSSFDYDLDPFVKFPLLELGSKRYTLCERHFFEEKFTHHSLFSVLDALTAPVDRRRDFKSWWGLVVQEYVWRIFRKHIAVPSAFSPYDVFYDLPFNRGSNRATDIICFLKNTGELFLFEITASHLQYSVFTKFDNWDYLTKDVKRIVVDKAKQINNTISAIKNGNIRLVPIDRPDAEVDAREIRCFRPFIITLKSFPSLPFIWSGSPDLWEGIYSLLIEKNYLTSADIAPLKIITVDEYEHLTELSRLGKSFFDILRVWSQDQTFSVLPLKFYLQEKYSSEMVQAEKQFGLEDGGMFEMIKNVLLGPESAS